MRKYEYYLSDETGAWNDLDYVLERASIKGELRRVANPFEADIVIAIFKTSLAPNSEEIYKLSWKLQFLKLIGQHNPKTFVCFGFEPEDDFTGEFKITSELPKYLTQKESHIALNECLSFYLALADIVKEKGVEPLPKPLPELTLDWYWRVIESRVQYYQGKIIDPVEYEATPTFIKIVLEM